MVNLRKKVGGCVDQAFDVSLETLTTEVNEQTRTQTG
jgi:hypothetical protein